MSLNGKNGLGIIISGPSGVGKGTIIQHLLKHEDSLTLAVSYTTRKPRDYEKEGINYHFVSIEEFEEKKNNNFFIEYAEVHGNHYGTGTDYIEKCKNGEKIIFEVDVEGASNLINHCKESKLNYISFFLLPPSIDELKKRLHNRGTENQQSKEQRIANAERELSKSITFNHMIVNDDIDQTVEKLKETINQHPDKSL